MTEISRVPATSSAVERGDVPEVAALGKELSELFNALGITQRAYAQKTSWSDSLVSRCLSGKKLATQDFIDRLIRAVEEHRNTPTRPEVGQHLRELRLAALKVTNPAEYRLEALRDELARSNRKVTRLAHREEALHLLIEKKEGEIQNLRGEIVQTHSDWAAEQAENERKEDSWNGQICGLSAERDDLVTELEELREDLRDALRLREQAEHQSFELRERVRVLEEKLAEREILDDLTEASLEEFRAALSRKWASERIHEVSKGLTAAAWSRELDEVIALVEWLQRIGDNTLRRTFVQNVARLRPVEEVISAGLALAELAEDLTDFMQVLRREEPVVVLADAAATSRPWIEISQLAKAWQQISFGPLTLGRRLLARAVNMRTVKDELLAVWERLQSVNVPESEIVAALSSIPCRQVVPKLPQLLRNGVEGRALQLLISVVDYQRTVDASAFMRCLKDIPEVHRNEISEAIANDVPAITAAKYVYMCTRGMCYGEIGFIAQGFASRGKLQSLLDGMTELQERDDRLRNGLENVRGDLTVWGQKGCPVDWDFDLLMRHTRGSSFGRTADLP
ncbi:helix-turn-helix domain-containing protein [Streptomyces sp. NPDC047049]|uniref:helix-turn-helix domain-containing protein n=1 Tax=Streptomyces sp. NPDC047049 TaxID=3156688 RepID=UPI0034070856